jgi:hypothetical protein
VRTLSLALCLAAFVAGVGLAQKPAAAPPTPATPRKRADANAQTPAIPGLPSRLHLIEGPAIDGTKEKFEHDIVIHLGPGGLMVVRAGWYLISAYDSTGKHLWTMDRGRESEIADVTALGWRGSQLWVSDSRFAQIALIDKGVVTKSLELPSWVRPSWTNRKSFPVFGSLDVYALFADGSMLVIPRRPHSLVGTVGYDSTMQYILHVSENGIIDRAVAKVPSQDYALRTAYSRLPRDGPGVIPPNAWRLSGDYWPRFRVSPDGMRTVTVSVDIGSATFDTVVVTAVNEKGAPVFTSKFGFPRVSYTEKQIDSLAMHQYGGSTADYRARRARAFPRVLPTVRDVTLGRDYSVWVTLRETAGAKPIVGIDGMGHFVGTIYIPPTFSLRAADRDRLWIVDYRPNFRDVVRYGIAKR